MKHLYPLFLLGILFVASCGYSAQEEAAAERAEVATGAAEAATGQAFIEEMRATEKAEYFATVDAQATAEREAFIDPPRGCPGGCLTYPTWCEPPIKGNVSQVPGKEDERIYHMPSDEFYDETKINREGEFYFCTPEEAEAAGFRRAYN